MIRENFNSLVENFEQDCTSLPQKFFLFGCGVLLSLILAYLIFKLCEKFAGKFSSTVERYHSELVNGTRYPIFWILFLIGVYHSLEFFDLSEECMADIYRGFFFVLMLCLLRVLLNIINIFSKVLRTAARKNGNVYRILLLDMLVPAAKVLIWLVTLLFILDNLLDFKVGTLLAGAGVASMAIAFAAQNTIANLFGAITLICDKPFMVGDYIRVSGKEGTVQSLGLRSTLLLAPDGVEWSIPNKLMAESTIENTTRRPYYRYTTVLNLTYAHTPEQLEKGKALIQEILAGHPMVDMEKNPPRITFENIGAYSLDLQFICWVNTRTLAEFSRIKDEINFRILKTFNDNGFDFAFPTQSICIEKMPEEKK